MGAVNEAVAINVMFHGELVGQQCAEQMRPMLPQKSVGAVEVHVPCGNKQATANVSAFGWDKARREKKATTVHWLARRWYRMN